jgi:DNA-binding NarL/FixJ family response regulator
MPNILIADDHDLVRDTIAAYLGSKDTFSTFTASNVEQAMKIMSGVDAIDLVILDYNMPGMNGLQGLEVARRRFPATRIVMMSGVANKEVATAAMELGADGFIPKSLAADSLINAIKFVLMGERYFPFEFYASAPEPEANAAFADLSDRERQTLEQLCNGLSNKEIARALSIQEVTVKLHVRNLFAKLGVANRTQAALMAKQANLF